MACPDNSNSTIMRILLRRPLPIINCLVSNLQRLQEGLGGSSDGACTQFGRLHVIVSNVPDVADAPVSRLLSPDYRCVARSITLRHNDLLAQAVDRLAIEWQTPSGTAAQVQAAEGRLNMESSSFDEDDAGNSTAQNSTLADSPCALGNRSGLALLDMYSSGHRILHHPQAYNFTDIEHPCLVLQAGAGDSRSSVKGLASKVVPAASELTDEQKRTATLCSDPAGHYFIDPLHFTSHAHILLARDVLPLLPMDWVQSADNYGA